jgi:hypothetical protein
MMQIESWKKAGLIISILGGIILIATSVFYIIADRFEVINKVDSMQKTIDVVVNSRITPIETRILKLESDKKTLNDIQYNLKRLLEKNGILWMPFDREY